METPPLPAATASPAAPPRSGNVAAAEVAILIVSFNGRELLSDCLASVLASDDGELKKHVIVVDNASTDGSAALVRERFPQVELIEAGGNLGFAEGNNVGWEYVRRKLPRVRYVYLLNQDTLVESGFLKSLVAYLETHLKVGSVQSKLRLHPQTDRVNTVGNRSHYLGFGFPTGYGQPDGSEYETPGPINYASGAGVMVRAELLERLGLFEPEMFMYLEDADLSWKLRQAGYEVHVVPQSVVLHKYRFNPGFAFYYHLERNRWWLLLVYYRLPTLLLLSPALLLMEAGQLLFAWRQKRLVDKLRAQAFFLSPRGLRLILRLRRRAQRRRVISDRQFLRDFASRIEFPEIQSRLLTHVANPIFAAYWWVVRRLLWW